jgi:hypothetical protein
MERMNNRKYICYVGMRECIKEWLGMAFWSRDYHIIILHDCPLNHRNQLDLKLDLDQESWKDISIGLPGA